MHQGPPRKEVSRSDRNIGTSTLLRQAIEEIRSLKASQNARDREPIAIVGAGNRFPGADTPEEFWELLRRGSDLTTERSGRRAGFLRDVGDFDPVFFGISPQDARLIDPQHRLLLETCWRALEDALIPASVVRDVPVGLFAGISHEDYAQLTVRSGEASSVAGPAALGAARSMGPGRTAYALGLTGPVMQVDTSCSSSLLAVHLACQSLRDEECKIALAGGVNLMLAPEIDTALGQLGALAPDGRCKTFDAAADGYVRGEGCGIVALKRLSAALEAGDRIRAVIAGSAVNHDGQSNGLTAPNGVAQEKLIARALRAAGLKADDIQYVEAHGTGTRLGDTVELMALARVLGEGRTGDLHLGAVKTNIGHLESAAGIAGLIKTVLMIEHGEIPPTLHLEQLNPHFPWQNYRFRVARESVAWPDLRTRRAGVSAFGMSGTNVHVIVASAPVQQRKPARPERRRHLLCISARSKEALAELKRLHTARLSEVNDDRFLADYCYSSRAGRTEWLWRIAVVGATPQELIAALDAAEPTEYRTKPRVCFWVRGGGEANVDDLIRTEPVFRKTFERCRNEPLYALQCGLGDLWKSWGIRPDTVLGDAVSGGAAAYLRGESSLEAGGTKAPESCGREDSGKWAGVGEDFVVEIGPAVYTGVRGISPGANERIIPSLTTDRSAEESLLAGLERLWCAGVPVDWAAFDGSDARRRVSLPFHPFFKKTYWADFRSKRPTEADATEPRTSLIHQLVWVPRELPAILPTQSSGNVRWLLIPDQAGLAADLAHALREKGCEVSISPSTAAIPKGEWNVVYLPGTDRRGEAIAATAQRHAVDFVGLAQKLADARAARSLWIVTRGDESPVEVVCANPAAAVLVGLTVSAAAEHPELKARLIDLDAAADRAADVNTLVRLLMSLEPPAAEIGAWRKGRLLVRRTEERPDRAGHLAFEARAERTYVITGGYGGVGLQIAHWLIDHKARNIALIGRNAAQSKACRAERELRAAGADVRTFSADVGDARSIESALARIRAEMPPLDGVVHAAGIKTDRLIRNHDPELFAEAFRAKVHGASNLHALTAGDDLGLFVLCSSVASILGGIGLASYAAANAFLDGLAHFRRAQGLPAVSINWGPWRDVGMTEAMDARLLAQWKSSHGLDSLTASEALAALERTLASGAVQAAIFRTSPQTAARAAEPQMSLRERLSQFAPSARRTAAVIHVRDIVAAKLGYEPASSLPTNEGFFQIGMDSLAGLAILNALRTTTGCTFPVTTLFTYSNVEEVGRFIVESLFPEQAPSGKADPVPNSLAASTANVASDDANAALLREIEEVEALLRTTA